MEKIIFSLGIVFQIVSLFSCQFFNGKSEETKLKPVARVHQTYLYQKDLQGMLGEVVSQKDSASIAQRYIDSWIKKQLLVYEAESNLDIDMNDVEKRVQEYKFQLLIYAYQKKYIEKNLDTVVTHAQIETYYKENSKNFELKQNIVRGLLLKVPKTASKLEELRNWLRSDSGDALDEIKSYAYSFAETPMISDTTWIDFEDMIVGTPFANHPNKMQLLGKNKNLEIAEEDAIYFIKIIDYKIADQIAPLMYLRKNIIDIIINKRKIELQEQHENEVLNKAEKAKNIEIFK
jgi:hypothetical protein